MPPGVPPLVLFRTMARSPRVFAKMFAGGLLDKGPLSLRQREIVIDRTTARLGCEYEWGVHIAFFAEKVGFTPEHVAATVTGPRDAACWTPEEQALIALVDDLVDRRAIADGDLEPLAAHFDEAQILEAIALVGYYHTISFLCRRPRAAARNLRRTLSGSLSLCREARNYWFGRRVACTSR